MNLRLFLSITFLIFCLLALPGRAGNDARDFDRDRLEEFSADPDFNYQQDYQKTESLLAVVLGYLLQKFYDLFGNPNLTWLGPVLIRLLIIAGIILLVLSIVKLKFSHVFRSAGSSFQNTGIAISATENEDYRKLLQESLNSQNYKLAVRYLFLSALITLEQQNVLRISRWKTPYEYLSELPVEKRMAFQHLVELFENTWYGDYKAEKESVEEGLLRFKEIQNA